MQQKIQCELISWDDVLLLTHKLAKQIQQSGYKPDMVIAIARGGYVPARLLCDYLDIYHLTSIRIVHYIAGTQKTEKARLTMPLDSDVTGLKILLVDDVDDTGDTLQLALEHIKSFKPADIKIAVLHHKHQSSLIPDFYAKEQILWRWITYPWAITEDVKSFIKRMDQPPTTPQEAQARLIDEFSIKLPLESVQEIYDLN